MKTKFSALALSILLSLPFAHGQLVVGGDITWQCASGTQAGKYVFTLHLFNQCDMGALGSTQMIQVINGPISSIALTKLSESDINPNCYDTAQLISCAKSTPGAISMATYQSTPVALSGVPPAGGWVFTWKTTQRQLTGTNLSTGSGMTLRSIMYPFNNQNASTCYDNSPQFIDAPITGFCTAYRSTFVNRSFDPDQDIVEYDFAVPLQHYSSWPPAAVTWKSGYSTNNPTPGTFFDPNSEDASMTYYAGEISFLARTVLDPRNYYVVKATSKRNGTVISEVFRELIIDHKTCPPTATIPPLSNTPPTLGFRPSPTAPVYPVPNPILDVTAGDTVQFFIQSNDIQFLPGFVGQSNTLRPRGDQFGTGLIDPLSGCDQPPCAVLDSSGGQYDALNKWFRGQFGAQTTFTWVTDSVHGSADGKMYHFHFNVQDDWCPYPGLTERTFSVRVYTPPDNIIEGIVFKDLNGNGVQDVGENGMPNIIVQQVQNNFLYNTAANGGYELGVYQGNFDITIPVLPKYHQVSAPASGTHSLTIAGTGNIYPGNDFGIEPIPNVNDLEVDVTASLFHRPGMTSGYWINYFNPGTTTLSGSVDFQYSGPITFISSTPTPAISSSGLLSWNFSNLAPGQGSSIHVSMRTDSTASIGDTVLSYLTINPLSGDSTPDNNVDSIERFVTAAYDPNLKHAYPEGGIKIMDIESGQMMEYTIYFQNTGTDTAFNVRVEDEIQASLVAETFEPIGSSHPMTYEMRGQHLTFYFDNIKLPDSSKNFNASIGFVKYRIQANSELLLGDTVMNQADIYFDLNAPVSTIAKNPVVVNVGGSVNPIASAGNNILIYPNPSSGLFNVQIENMSGESLTYEVYSIAGKQITNGRLNVDVNGNGKSVINLSSVPNGVYFVRFLGENDIITQKLVLR